MTGGDGPTDRCAGDASPQPAAPPDTPAVRAVRASGVAYRVLVTPPAADVDAAAKAYGIPVARLLKTLVLRRGDGDHLLVLIPGPRQLDWRKLRQHLGVSRVSLPDAEAAAAVTGYVRGTITPFGTRTPLPVVIDASVADDGEVTVGGGARGVAIRLTAPALIAAVAADVADVTRPAR